MSESGDIEVVTQTHIDVCQSDQVDQNCNEATPNDLDDLTPVPELGETLDLVSKIDENDILLPKLEEALLADTSQSNTPSEGNTSTTPNDLEDLTPVPELGDVDVETHDLIGKIDENDILLPKLEEALLADTSRSNTPSEGNTSTTPNDLEDLAPVPELGDVDVETHHLIGKIDENDILLPKLEEALLADTSRSNTPSEGNTPRGCDSSSGSPSPIPDDGDVQRPRIQLGRDISLMMQALNSLHSPEEKIAALCKKYADLLEHQKMKEKRLRGMERKATQGTKEREQMQKDLNKALLGKSKMESLARELNKQNKLLKQESFNATLRHNKEREIISDKFKSTTDEISGKINSIAERNELLNQQNQEMAAKMVKLVDETKGRENTIKNVLEQRDLQEQILGLKLRKSEEERKMTLEKQTILVEESSQVKSLCEGYMQQEKDLKAQITYYSEKFEDFQSTLDKSNKIFASFRSEMDRMNTKMRDLEKTTAMWKKNYEECNAENMRIMSSSSEQNRLINNLKKKLARLTNLSRALQAERNVFAKNARQPKKCADTVTAEATSTVNSEGTTPEILDSSIARDKKAEPTSEAQSNDVVPENPDSTMAEAQVNSSNHEAPHNSTPIQVEDKSTEIGVQQNRALEVPEASMITRDEKVEPTSEANNESEEHSNNVVLGNPDSTIAEAQENSSNHEAPHDSTSIQVEDTSTEIGVQQNGALEVPEEADSNPFKNSGDVLSSAVISECTSTTVETSSSGELPSSENYTEETNDHITSEEKFSSPVMAVADSTVQQDEATPLSNGATYGEEVSSTTNEDVNCESNNQEETV